MSRAEIPFGTCELCEADADIINILPITQPDGKLDTMACTGCSESSGVYCLEHKRPHLGFNDNTTACAECIETELDENTDYLCALFISTLTGDDKNKMTLTIVDRWYSELSKYTNDGKERCIARAIVTVAQRFDINPEEVIERTSVEGTSVLLPNQIIRDLTLREN